MTFEEFRQRYGSAFYEFINSELGQAFITVMEKNDPGTRVVGLPPESQTANSTLFLGQITGWRDAILAAQNQCVVRAGGHREVEATYESDDSPGGGHGNGGGDSLPAPAPPAPIIIKQRKPNRRKPSK